jgi:DNA-binding LytR/AlgR family response regulator
MASELSPDVAFLDIRMPGMSGIDVARTFGSRTHVVFVTAYSEHAVSAFDEGAVDYLLKPLDPVRLARTIARLRERMTQAPPALDRIMQRLEEKRPAPSWIQASIGSTVQFIDLADVLYFAAEDKYTRVVTEKLQAHIRTPLKELGESLESAGFWQVHRSYVVAVKRIGAAVRDADGAMWISLKERPERLPVSQRFQGRFKGM